MIHYQLERWLIYYFLKHYLLYFVCYFEILRVFTCSIRIMQVMNIKTIYLCYRCFLMFLVLSLIISLYLFTKIIYASSIWVFTRCKTAPSFYSWVPCLWILRLLSLCIPSCPATWSYIFDSHPGIVITENIKLSPSLAPCLFWKSLGIWA